MALDEHCKTVLVLEDDVLELMDLEDDLKKLGYNIVSSEDKKTFLQRLDDTDFYAIILDNNCPLYPGGVPYRDTGIKVAQEVKDQYPTARIALHTKLGLEKDIAMESRCEQIGITLLYKPASMEGLKSFLEN